jgi:hypothetical protein
LPPSMCTKMEQKISELREEISDKKHQITDIKAANTAHAALKSLWRCNPFVRYSRSDWTMVIANGELVEVLHEATGRRYASCKSAAEACIAHGCETEDPAAAPLLIAWARALIAEITEVHPPRGAPVERSAIEATMVVKYGVIPHVDVLNNFVQMEVHHRSDCQPARAAATFLSMSELVEYIKFGFHSNARRAAQDINHVLSDTMVLIKALAEHVMADLDRFKLLEVSQGTSAVGELDAIVVGVHAGTMSDSEEEEDDDSVYTPSGTEDMEHSQATDGEDLSED